MRGLLQQIRPRHLVVAVLLLPIALATGSLLSETPSPVAYAEPLGFPDPYCGAGWTHGPDLSPPFTFTDTNGVFTRVGIKSGGGCIVVTTNGTTPYGCYLVTGIGTSTVTVTDTGAGCEPINYIVATLQYATYTPTVPADTATPTSTSTPTRTPTATATNPGPPTRTPTQAPFVTNTPTLTPTATEEDGETPTPTSTEEYPPTETPTVPPTDLPTATPTEIPVIPVTAVDPCCQQWLWLMIVILILEIFIIAGVLILAARIRRLEKPRQ